MSDGTHKRRFSVVASAVIAVLLGALLLTYSYAGAPEHSFIEGATHEVGFALIVAVIIWVTFEFFSRGDMEARWNERIERVSKSVFFGVFKRNFPDDLVKEAQTLLLDHDFVRSDLHVNYTLSDATYVGADGSQRPFVRLGAVARYRVRNVSDKTSGLPIAILLPNPIIDQLKPHCKVLAIRIRVEQDAWREILLNDAETKFREKLANDRGYACPFDAGFESLKPGQEAELVFDYVMAKEEEDTEIFQTKYPARNLTINIVDLGATKRIVRARSIHVAQLENDSPSETRNTYSYRLSRYLLPHQGFAIWWKKAA